MVASLLPDGCIQQRTGRFGRVRNGAARSAGLTTLVCMCIIVAAVALASTVAGAFAVTHSESTLRPSRALRGSLATGMQSRSASDRLTSSRVSAHATATAVAIEDPWVVLGVSRDSTSADVKKTYRKRALKEHPDINRSPDAIANWLRLSEAYATLSDPEKLKAWKASKSSQRWSTTADWRNAIPKEDRATSRWKDPEFNPFGKGYVGVATAAVGVAGEVADEAFIGSLAAAVDAFDYAKKTHEAVKTGGIDHAANIAMKGGMVITGRAADIVGNVARLATTGGVGIASRAAETGLESISPEGRQMALMTLEELLSFLGQPPPEDPRGQISYIRRLQDRIEAFMEVGLPWESPKPARTA